MKCTDIHNDFPEKEVRDFLAQQWDRHGQSGSQWALDNARAELVKAQEHLHQVEQAYAAEKLIERMGWHLFDVSEDVDDYKSVAEDGDYRPFVGTDVEVAKVFPNRRG